MRDTTWYDLPATPKNTIVVGWIDRSQQHTHLVHILEDHVQHVGGGVLDVVQSHHARVLAQLPEKRNFSAMAAKGRQQRYFTNVYIRTRERTSKAEICLEKRTKQL